LVPATLGSSAAAGVAARWRDRVIVRVPDPAEAAFFQLADDGRIAIMEIRRTAFQASGAPVRLTVTTCPADRNELLFSTGQVPAESS
jgi:DNA-binding GntR family transcriptional regulator